MKLKVIGTIVITILWEVIKSSIVDFIKEKINMNIPIDRETLFWTARIILFIVAMYCFWADHIHEFIKTIINNKQNNINQSNDSQTLSSSTEIISSNGVNKQEFSNSKFNKKATKPIIKERRVSNESSRFISYYQACKKAKRSKWFQILTADTSKNLIVTMPYKPSVQDVLKAETKIELMIKQSVKNGYLACFDSELKPSKFQVEEECYFDSDEFENWLEDKILQEID